MFAHVAAQARKNQRLGLAALSFVQLQSRRPAEAVYLGLAAWPRRPDPTIDLADCRVALRALENAGTYHRAVLRIAAQDKRISCVAFSPDGRLIVSGDSSNTLQLWDAQTGGPVGAPITGHEEVELYGISSGYIHCVAFSPDGTRIVSGGEHQVYRVWDTQTGAQIGGPMEGDRTKLLGSVGRVAFSPDGTRIASAGHDDALSLWDARTGIQIGEPLVLGWDMANELGTNSIDGKSLTLSPDGTRIAIGNRDGTILRWNLSSGLPYEGEMRTSGEVVGVAFSGDGTRIVSVSAEGTMVIWDAQSGKKINESKTLREGSLTDVAFSSDGSRVATVDKDGMLRLWDAKTGDPIGTPMFAHESSGFAELTGLKCVAFSLDDARIVSGGEDGMILLWDLATGCHISRMAGHAGRVRSLAFFPDGARIVSGSGDGKVRLWDVDYGPGNLFEILYRRLPTRNPPAILATYGIELDEPICSGEEPLPPFVPKEDEP